MTENMTFRDITIKVLTITGFLVTVAVIAWGTKEAIVRIPGAFSSLASIAESINTYKPIHELTLTTEKAVVNSGESFELLWNDVHQTGEFKFTYTCASGVRVNVRTADGSLMEMNCSDTLTLPATVHGLYLSIDSSELRFTDILLKVSFSNTDKSETFENTTKVTVVNAIVTLPEITPIVEEKEEVAPTLTETPIVIDVPVVSVPTEPITETVLPVQGRSDLAMIILGSGVLENGTFEYTSSYKENLNNALRFDVKNVGTKTSDTWYFNVVLPSGKVYTSPMQAPLNPHDHIEFTLGFYLSGEDMQRATLTTMLHSNTDTNASNNSKSITVNVR